MNLLKRLEQELDKNDHIYIGPNNTVLDNKDVNDDIAYYAYIEPMLAEFRDGAVIVHDGLQGDVLVVSNYNTIISVQVLHDQDLQDALKGIEDRKAE